MESLRVASVAWKIRDLRTPGEWTDHFVNLTRQARGEGADLIVFPELIDLERLSLFPELPQREIAPLLSQTNEPARDLMGQMHVETGCDIVGGSLLWQDGDRVVNRCFIFSQGKMSWQDKIVMTQFELLEWGVSPGAGLSVSPSRPFGVTVCYDSEFPAAGLALAEAGIWIHCVPAFTETKRGYQRVRWSCRARTVENQIYVVHASLVGALGREPVPSTFGNSAVFCPSVLPFPESAVLAETQLHSEGIAVADLSLRRVEEARQSDDVRNWEDRRKGDWSLNIEE
ncbi:MAG: hypothetical protein MUC92_12085 [Fimbriimonadaceae bacterium]|jgi:predicted amidohydrolase|nr:hypothetical protein [Fimbriimonadaceae bacterium]